MNPRRLTNRLMIAAVAGAAMIALGGCGGDKPGATASSSASPVTNDDARTAWLDVAKCMRSNGYPDFPDPQQNEFGVWDVSVPLDGSVPAPCDPLIRKAKTGSRGLSALTAEEMNKLRQYAKCMRENGLQNFPDPDEQGNFGSMAQFEGDPNYAKAQNACKQFAPPQRPK